MNKSKSIDVLIQITREKLDDSGRNLAQINAQRQHSQSQLDALANYRSDYSLKLQNTSNDGISSASYHNFRRFINHLDDAISQQKQLIQNIDTSLTKSRDLWLGYKRKLNSYETLKARQLKTIQVRAQRNEQKATDEISAGMLRRHKFL